jgi:hypothetical protein
MTESKLNKFFPLGQGDFGDDSPKVPAIVLILLRYDCTEKQGIESYVLHIHEETRQAAGRLLRQKLS